MLPVESTTANDSDENDEIVKEKHIRERESRGIHLYETAGARDEIDGASKNGGRDRSSQWRSRKRNYDRRRVFRGTRQSRPLGSQ